MEPFKNAISPGLVRLTGDLLAQHLPGGDADAFAAPLIPQLDALELKQRVGLIADALHQVLPTDHAARQAVLLALLHPDDEGRANGKSSGEGLCGWGIWPLTTVIGQHGLGPIERSLDTLREMTKRGTSEFDVRPFIASDPGSALPIIQSWADDPNYHVRRLVSEGTRPRLPWGMRLQALVEDPSPMLPVLARLRDDPSDYVRRSVANHLNDIAKDHPDLVARVAAEWMERAGPDRVKLLRHACRTLVKAGHAEALALFGFQAPQIAEPVLRIENSTVRIEESLSFDVSLRSAAKTPQQLVIDYVIHHQKANGTLSPKVFKWTTLSLAPGEERRLARNHTIKPVTTRRYHAGPHALSLRINGVDFGYVPFDLEIAPGE